MHCEAHGETDVFDAAHLRGKKIAKGSLGSKIFAASDANDREGFMHWHTHTPTRSNVTISGMPSSGLFPHTLATHANVEGPPRTNTKRANDALTIINIHAVPNVEW